MIVARFLRGLRRLRAERRGIALVEFALAAPVMIVLYLGSYQIEDVITCNRKTTIATRATADLVAQNLTGTTSAAEVDGDLYAATLVLAPYSPSNAVIRVTEVGTDNTGKTTVQWSRVSGTNATPYAQGSVATIPIGLQIPGTYFLWAEVTYNYSPSANFGFVNSMKLYDSIYMIPRNSTSVSCPDC